MLTCDYVGGKLCDFLERTGHSRRETRVFVLKNGDDITGKFLVMGYSLRQIVSAYPFLAEAEVKYAEDFHGEMILRVWIDPDSMTEGALC